MAEVYKSSTLGAIPLSFTGRHLLQSLREAVADYAKKVDRAARMGTSVNAEAWEPVSLARGKLAQYMSQLEKRSSVSDVLRRATRDELALELETRRRREFATYTASGYRVMMGKLLPPSDSFTDRLMRLYGSHSRCPRIPIITDSCTLFDLKEDN